MIQERKRDLRAKICHLGGRVSKRDKVIKSQRAVIQKLQTIINEKNIVIKHFQVT